MTATATNVTAINGLCSFCGHRGPWAVNDKASLRENYLCGKCKAPLRYRNQAAAILGYFGQGRHAALRDLIADQAFQKASVYEVGIRGPFAGWLSKLERYTRSYLWPDVRRGQVKDGVRCEDVTRLTFEDQSFDLIISSEVMGHVFDYQTAFKELWRVLKPGGYHVFTTPLSWPLAASTVERATEKGGRVRHHQPARFVTGGDGAPSLVCTEFGADLLDLLAGLGYNAWLARPSITEYPMYRDAVVVAQRPAELRTTRARGK